MRYVTLFVEAVGGRWFFLPATVTGLAGLMALLQAQGVTWIPATNWWALAFFALLPVTMWSVAGLLKKAVSLERENASIKGTLDQRAHRTQAASSLTVAIEELIQFKNRVAATNQELEIEQAASTFDQDRQAIFNRLGGVLSAPEIYAISLTTPTSMSYAGNTRRSEMMLKIDCYIANARNTLSRYA
jgi:hypothetical protein